MTFIRLLLKVQNSYNIYTKLEITRLEVTLNVDLQGFYSMGVDCPKGSPRAITGN